MELQSPWVKPISRRNGITTPNITLRMDPALKQAIEEMANREAIKYNTYLSKGTIILNLMTRNSDYLSNRRVELAQRLEQLKRGTDNDTSTTHKKIDIVN